MTAPEWTEERLAALDEAAKKATPGEWEPGGVFDPMGEARRNLWSPAAHGAQSGKVVAQAMTEADAHFVRLARRDLPGLVAEVRRLKGLLLSLIASTGLADHMGDVADDVDKVLKDLPLAIEWDDLSDLAGKLGKMGVRTVWGTELGKD